MRTLILVAVATAASCVPETAVSFDINPSDNDVECQDVFAAQCEIALAVPPLGPPINFQFVVTYVGETISPTFRDAQLIDTGGNSLRLELADSGAGPRLRGALATSNLQPGVSASLLLVLGDEQQSSAQVAFDFRFE